MKIHLKHKFLTVLSLAILASSSSFAGNEDRAGSAGSTDLLINPWARSSGFGGANSAFGKGLEANFMNVAGMAFTKKTEVLFAHTRWLMGTDIGINSFGFSQKFKGKNAGPESETGNVIGLSVNVLGSGAIEETRVNQPEGTGVTYSVSNFNIGLHYARSFSNKIHGGATVRIINQTIANVSASGVAIDAGIIYRTTLGKETNELRKDNFHIGISIKNIGPRMSANGDGLSVSNVSTVHGAVQTQQQRSVEYELPTLMNIGLGFKQRINMQHSFDFGFNFTSNSFTADQFTLGVEYNFIDCLMLRGAYTFEKGTFGSRDGVTPDLLNAFTGPSCGLSFETAFKKDGKVRIGVDYAFRATQTFNGVHTFGARLLFN